MRGAGITRYHAPHRQMTGGGFITDLAAAGWKGFKSGLKSGNSHTPNLRSAVTGAKRGVKRAAKRSIEKEVTNRVRKGLDDLFGP